MCDHGELSLCAAGEQAFAGGAGGLSGVVGGDLEVAGMASGFVFGGNCLGGGVSTFGGSGPEVWAWGGSNFSPTHSPQPPSPFPWEGRGGRVDDTWKLSSESAEYVYGAVDRGDVGFGDGAVCGVVSVMNVDVDRLHGSARLSYLHDLIDLAVASERVPSSLRSVLRLVARHLLFDCDETIRNDAAEALGSYGTRAEIFALRQACSDESWVVRSAAYSALASVGGRKYFGILCRMVRQEKHGIARKWAYVAAFDADRDRAESFLLDAHMEEVAVEAEIGILSCLRECGHDWAITRLKEIQQQCPSMSYAVATALGEAG